MLKKAEKEELVCSLTKALQDNPNVFIVDYSGVATPGLNALRNTMRQRARFQVVKKTLFARALGAAGLSSDAAATKTQIAIAFSFSDPAEAAQALFNFAKEHETFTLLGGILDREAISGADVARLAVLPPRKILLGTLLGVLAGPIRNFAYVVSGPQRGFVSVLSQRSIS